MDRFAGRLGARFFAGDGPVGIAVVARGAEIRWRPEAPDQAWIPRGALMRLVYLGRAYSLHGLSHVDPLNAARLGPDQARGMREELEFLRLRVVDDPWVENESAKLIDLAHQCERAPAASELVIAPG